MKTNHLPKGITLIEVLVSVFVIGIGLLGVLAVIPFGAYQASKASNAQYLSSMLANAEHEIKIRKLAYPTTWGTDAKDSETDEKITGADSKVDCTKIVVISAATKPEDDWKEIFQGQDDYDYKIDEATNRPDLMVEKPDGTLADLKSTGRYTWFFTYRLYDSLDDATKAAPPADFKAELASLSQPVNVDILGCYNRVPDDDLTALAVTNFQPALDGGTLTLDAQNHQTEVLEKLAQTEYVLVSWDDAPKPRNGAWCKILFVDKNAGGSPRIIVSTEGDAIGNTDIKVRIKNGVIYHKRVEGVKIK
jgi:prepilin-type N-terminal cleavage/methylation domain-containing protein